MSSGPAARLCHSGARERPALARFAGGILHEHDIRSPRALRTDAAPIIGSRPPRAGGVVVVLSARLR